MTNAGLQIQQAITANGRGSVTGYTPRQFSETRNNVAQAGTYNTSITLEEWVLVEYTIAASGTQDIDLNDSSLLNPEGTGIAFNELKYAYFEFQSDNTASAVRIGNASSNAHSLWFGADAHTVDLINGGPAQVMGGSAKTVDGTNKIVKLENLDGSNSAKVRVWFAGGIA